MRKPNTKNVVLATLIAGLLVVLPAVVFAGGQGEGSAADGRMSITWQLREEESYAASIASEKFDVEIIGNGIWNNDSEKIDLMFASGETPEVFMAGDDAEHYRDGLIREIPLEMVQEYAPLHVKWMNEHPLAWKISKSPDNPDNFIGMIGIAVTGDYPLIGSWSTRADWAEKVGMPIPDYEEKRFKLSVETDRTWFAPVDVTLDWVEDLLIAYRDGDPDGNGKNDTIPVSACEHVNWSWATLFGAFGMPMYSFGVGSQGTANYEENGEMVIQAISPRFKNFLTFLNGWYEKDLIDKEFPTLDLRKMWEKDVAEITGVQFTSNATYVGPTLARPPNHVSLDKVEEGASIAMLPPPIGPDGYQGVQRYTAHTVISNWNSLKVRADVSDEKLAKILQIWDWRQHGDGWFVCHFGKEGVHFDWSGEPFNSKPNRVPMDEVAEQHPDEPKLGKFFHYPYAYHADKIRWVYSAPTVQIFDNWFIPGNADYYLTRPYKWDVFQETNLREMSERYGEGLNTLSSEFYARAITGQVNIDAEWDSYVNTWLSNGGQEYYDELVKAVKVEPLNEKGTFEY